MTKLEDIISDENYSSEIREAAMAHDFESVRALIGKPIYFLEEVKSMDTEELFDAWLNSGEDKIQDYANQEEWEGLNESFCEEERELALFESDRQDI